MSGSDQRDLARLIESRHACIRISTFEENRVLDLLRRISVDLGRDLYTWTNVAGIRHGLLGEEADAVKDTTHPAGALYHLATRQSGEPVVVMLDLVQHLEDAATLRALRDTIERFGQTGATLVLVDHQDRFPSVVAAHSTPLELSIPDVKALRQIARQTLRRINRERKLNIELTRPQFNTLLKNLRGLNHRQAEQVITDATTDATFDAADVNHVLATKRRAIQADGLLQYVKTPVSLDDVGGLNGLKRWLKRRRVDDDEALRDFGLEPARGVLMLGVQGAGKSLCAKAIATAWQWPLLRLDPGSLYNAYIGESERRLRDALAQAESMAPIVLWIDEIEKGFASAASRSTDGGLSQRMFGSLLTWMQEHDAPVFLVATANDIEALPPELLRKGRFDEIFFVDLPKAATRRAIFTIHLRRRQRDPAQFDLDRLVKVSDGFSGAEIEQAIVAALYEAFHARRELTTESIVRAVEESVPLSVTMAERVAALRTWAAERCVPAD